MVHPSPTILSSSVGTSAPEPLLVRYIRAHVRKGEAAKERAAQNHKKSEDHFIAAGQYLTMLKVTYAPTWQRWEALLKAKVKLSTGRASELMCNSRMAEKTYSEFVMEKPRAWPSSGHAVLHHRPNVVKKPPTIFLMRSLMRDPLASLRRFRTHSVAPQAGARATPIN